MKNYDYFSIHTTPISQYKSIVAYGQKQIQTKINRNRELKKIRSRNHNLKLLKNCKLHGILKAKFKKMNINSNVDYSKSLLNEVIHYSMKDGRVSYLFNSEQVSRLNKFFRDVLGDDSCVEIIPDINDLGDVTLFEVRGARTFDRKEKTLVNKKLRSRGYVC
jgi:hypothetical protein